MKVAHAKRLLKLVEFLERLPRRKFNFGVWVSGWDGANMCGTSGCAIGWAATMPAFNRLGLKQRVRETYYETTGEVVWAPRGRVRRNASPLIAAQELFGMTNVESFYCFTPERYLDSTLPRGPIREASPKVVAEHLRRFLRYKGFEA